MVEGKEGAPSERSPEERAEIETKSGVETELADEISSKQQLWKVLANNTERAGERNLAEVFLSVSEVTGKEIRAQSEQENFRKRMEEAQQQVKEAQNEIERKTQKGPAHLAKSLVKSLLEANESEPDVHIDMFRFGDDWWKEEFGKRKNNY